MTIGIPISAEDRKFVAAVQSKTAEVAAAYKQHGRNLFALATPAIKQAMVTVSAMQHRLAGGDCAITVAEKQALVDYSEWLVEAWHRLRGTEIPKTTWVNDRV